MSAREIIAAILARDAGRKYVLWQDSELSDTIVEQLTAAGHRILGPDELCPVTVERCAIVADTIDQKDTPGTSRWLALGNFAGDIRDAIRALSPEAPQSGAKEAREDD